MTTATDEGVEGSSRTSGQHVSSRFRRVMRQNGLGLFVGTVFVLVWLIAQGFSGMRTYNSERREHGAPALSTSQYFRSAHFGEATFENWESEFLQMGMYVAVTVKLRQRGSAESKPLDEQIPQDDDPLEHRDDPGVPWPVRRGGLALKLYKNSLSTAFLVMFALSFILHAWTGSHESNAEAALSGDPSRVSTWGFMHHAQFWFQSFQNWQSEFLAVFALVVLTIFLRQHGSPQSKAVHAPHSETGD